MWHLPAIVLTASAAILALVQARAVTWNAVFWFAITLLLVWLAVRPKRERQRPIVLLRSLVYGALAFSAAAVAMVLLAALGTSEEGRGLAVVAAVVAVPSALWMWWMVYAGWKRGWRWGGPSTTSSRHEGPHDKTA